MSVQCVNSNVVTPNFRSRKAYKRACKTMLKDGEFKIEPTKLAKASVILPAIAGGGFAGSSVINVLQGDTMGTITAIGCALCNLAVAALNHQRNKNVVAQAKEMIANVVKK